MRLMKCTDLLVHDVAETTFFLCCHEGEEDCYGNLYFGNRE